ncbi:helix-turn-helix domain-containing protein [Secundilactobacillus oryzae]|nr:helix-turn-helix domain-containing protein [Secundilactobacillus oryzae]
MEMTLTDFAKSTGVTEDRIREYVHAGLLPSHQDQPESAWQFGDSDQYWLDMIACFHDNGTSLDDLKALMLPCQTAKNEASQSLMGLFS